MIKNGDLPAMPVIEESKIEQYNGTTYTTATAINFGLTKREQFAMAAMQGLCADIVNVYEHLCGLGEVPTDYLARQAVFAADALLAELEKSK